MVKVWFEKHMNLYLSMHFTSTLQIQVPLSGLFIRSFLEIRRFSFGLPKCLSKSVLRKKIAFQHGSLRNKGKSSQSKRKYSCHCPFLLQELIKINAAKGSCIFGCFFFHCNSEKISKIWHVPLIKLNTIE